MDRNQPESATGRSTRRSLLKAAAGAGMAGSVATAGCSAITTPADTARATQPAGNVDYFVGAEWLAEHREEVVVLDARQEALFYQERIHGARRVPLSGITTRDVSSEGLIPAVSEIEATFEALGITTDDDVLVYGDSVGSRVTRTVFALLSCGHRGSVKILNGGFRAWNGRVGTASTGSIEQQDYESRAVDSLWVTKEWIAQRIDEAVEFSVLDVRVPEAFLAAAGSDALNHDQNRHGHIPGAVNVHWLGNIARGSLTDPGELFSLYSGQAGLQDDQPVVVYGDENVNATQTWVTLRALGFDDVRLYEGGFTEWANSEDHGRFPIETATDAVIDVEGETGGSDARDFTCS